jgi:hypothetical protein
LIKDGISCFSFLSLLDFLFSPLIILAAMLIFAIFAMGFDIFGYTQSFFDILFSEQGLWPALMPIDCKPFSSQSPSRDRCGLAIALLAC